VKPAIVYLAQNTSRDAQYRRNSRALLDRSLDLLFKNYNDRFEHDVLIFHEGDFDDQAQREVARGRRAIKFHEIRLAPPAFLAAEDIPEVWRDGSGYSYTIGYRNMIRFYAVLLFDALSDLGYDWFFRMDDDSFIHSPIDYDLFKFMEENGYEYGYRVDIRESDSAAIGFGDAVLAYLAAEQFELPPFFAEHIKSTPFKKRAKNLVHQTSARLGLTARKNLTSAFRYDLCGYYNNFFITKISFWKRADVQAFIRHFDRIGGWYKYRWGDAIFQSAAVQLFLPKSKVHKFTDWTYEHTTMKAGKLDWGGIYQGSNDRTRIAVARFKELHGVTSFPPGQSY
jgi:alpha 1,2-mannosyltransferase